MKTNHGLRWEVRRERDKLVRSTKYLADTTTVVCAAGDPNSTAAGGAERFAAAGVRLVADVQPDLVKCGSLREWLRKSRGSSSANQMV